jgi:hypothetical protein
VLFAMCNGAVIPLPAGAPGTGDTTQTGLYNVVTCWLNAAGGPGLPVQTTFVIFNSNSVPEFPMGMFVVVGVALAIVMVLRAGIRKGNVPVLSR